MNNKKSLKKETKALVYQKIGVALADVKAGVKEKSFNKKLKKASNLLAGDIIKAAKADKAKSKKAIKKAATRQKKIAGKSVSKMNNIPVLPEVQPLPEK